MSSTRQLVLLITVAALAAGSLPAAPIQLEVEGIYRDTMYDSTGLTFKKNVSVGPLLTPGVRVALGNWSWVQSYTPASEALYTPFDAPGAEHNLTQVIRDSATALVQAVGLWQREYRISESLDLAPGIAVTTYIPTSAAATATVTVIPDMAGMQGLPGRFAFRGPRDTSLAPTRDYTATFRAFFCDDPFCTPPMDTAGVEVGFYQVAWGNLVAASIPFHTGSYGGTPAGEFFNEGVPSPVTLEWQVPYPLPPGDGWEYRLKLTMTSSGVPVTPPCAPNCTATLWAETVTVMAKGRKIPNTGFIVSCGGGQKPCGTQCIPQEAPCGWDAATLYTDSGSYVSPVFDSLSEQTVWSTIWWNVEQHYTAGGSCNGWPRTPVSIKWRVGNSLDPRTWLAKPEWFTWTIPNSVTCSGEELNCAATSCALGPCDCTSAARDMFTFPCDMVSKTPIPYRVPMCNQGTASLYRDGHSEFAVGRYFQYEVDFTGQFANDKYPPEVDTATTSVRELHDAYRPMLRAMRASYRPARGQVISKAIRPAQLLKWKAVTYTVDTASGGSVEVDVLDERGDPLFTRVPSGFSLAGLDPAQYPALKLRASVDNGGMNIQRPSLLSWEVRWDTFTDPLLVNCNAINLALEETCRVTVVMPAARPGTLSVHDGAGQLVKTLFKGVFGAGVASYTWDGSNGQGDRVATGVYFVSLRAKDIRRMKKLAVSR